LSSWPCCGSSVASEPAISPVGVMSPETSGLHSPAHVPPSCPRAVRIYRCYPLCLLHEWRRRACRERCPIGVKRTRNEKVVGSIPTGGSDAKPSACRNATATVKLPDCHSALLPWARTDERTPWSVHGAFPWPADDVISDCGATAPHQCRALERGARRRVGLASGSCAPRLQPSWLTAAIPECHRRGDETSGMAAHLECLRNLAVRQRVD